MKAESALHLAPSGLFRTVTEQLAGTVGEDFFRTAVRSLAFSLDVEYAFITERKPQDFQHLRLVAAWHVNRAATGDSELTLDGTPAALTLLEKRLWHEDDVASRYPKDRWLRKHGVRAYCAVAIPGLDGQAIGHLGLMSRQPLQANDELFATLDALARRTAAELRRRRLDEIQRLTAAKLAAGFRTTPVIIGAADLADLQLTDISPSIEKWLGYSPAELIGKTLIEGEFIKDPEERSQAVQELKAGGRIVNRDIALNTRSGQPRHGRLSAEVFEFAARPHILFNIVDDTDYRAALDQVRELDVGDEAAHPSKAKSQSEPESGLAAERSYQTFFENAVEGIYQSTTDGQVIRANPALARILGYNTPQELIADNLNIASRIYVRSEQRAELLRRLENDGAYFDQEFQIFRRDGSTIWVCDNSRAVKDETGKALYYEGTLQDVTGRKRAEDALVRSEEKYRMLVDMSQDGVFLSQSGKYAYVNRSFAYMLGYEPEEMAGLPVATVVMPTNGKFSEQIATDMVGHHTTESHEMQLRCKNGKTQITASLAVCSTSWRGRPASIGTVRDVTEHKKTEQQLLHSAYHDVLTGLPNRSFFMERLSQALEANTQQSGKEKFAVLFLDLDRFKLINDSLGHSFGDRLLVAITKRLFTCLRPADLIARYGGDEFTILLERIQNLDEATAVADRIHEELARAFNVNSRDVFSTASIGIVISAAHYQHADELLRDADTAMYRAKAAGKAGYVVFDDAMHEHVKANLKLETELRHALQRNEFRVYFQPVIELATGRLTGFEALVRWAHPDRGLVPPEQFLSVAEETGLIIPLGWWVMETACVQLSQWRKRYKHLDDNITVSVNIANRQFAHWVLPQRVARVLDMTGIPARNLCLEITETVFMDNPKLAGETVNRLRTIGVNLQMDDFGTGYSSLSALRTFKLDTLKIDRSFISGIEQNRSDRAIVRTITVLAADLGMDVVAEGIENSRQLELLRALGCRRGQGYYFSKPFAPNEVDRYLAALAPPKRNA